MDNITLNEMYKFFEKFTAKYYTDDEEVQKNIKLKEDHTKRVVEDSKIIADSINLNSSDKNIAQVVGLFHDIGRFEQLKKYKTFNDRLSENHAELGVKVLNETGIMNNLDKDEAQMIIEAVRCHNMYKVPKQKNDKYITFVNIIRDADKLDIYKVFSDYYKEMDKNPNPTLEQNLPDDGRYNMEIVNGILNLKNTSSKLLRSRYDLRLQTLTWVFDINYKKTLELISERKYIEGVLKVLPHNQDMENVRSVLFKYIENKLK